jgi:hypothetical protein
MIPGSFGKAQKSAFQYDPAVESLPLCSFAAFGKYRKTRQETSPKQTGVKASAKFD